MRAWTRVLVLGVSFCALPVLASAQSLTPLSERVQAALDEMRVGEAVELSEGLGDSALDLSVRSRVHFYQGHYAQAVEAMEASLEAEPEHPRDRRPGELALFRSTLQATANFVHVESEDGRYRISHAPGPDRHLVDYALRVLRQVDQSLTEELGIRLQGPIRLEIVPSADTLAALSTLEVEDVARTGTIALCKWDKLMVTSPRALLRGYPWMDTISHEFVHLVVAHLTHDRTPVWLQEGLAKFLERRWREPRAQLHLTPSSRGILSNALENDSLLAFDRIHPSIALLPSQEQAALAFAQVSTFVARYYEVYGRDTLRAALLEIADGQDAREAMATQAARRFAELESEWRRSLEHTEDAPPLLQRELRRGQASEMEPIPEALSEEARRRVRLGDLLWGRQRHGAAAHQYALALEEAPGDPALASRLARAAVAGDQAQLARDTLIPISERHPDHASTWALLSRAYDLAGDVDDARVAARRALSLNPFDPMPHCVLGNRAEAEQERAEERGRCSELSRR